MHGGRRIKKRVLLFMVCCLLLVAGPGCQDGTVAGDSCGNGSLDAEEDCDGTLLNQKTCADVGYGNGTLACRADCQFDTSGCGSANLCGNSALDSGEECDGSLLNGKSCLDFGFSAGSLACSSSCQFDKTGCNNGNPCGNGDIDSGEDCDSDNLNGKGCGDFGKKLGFLTCDQNCHFDTRRCVCPQDQLDFAAIRQSLNSQNKELAFAKIGFHAGPGGNHDNLSEWMQCLDAAKVPFFIKSVDVASWILQAAQLRTASGIPHAMVYRKCGEEYDVPNYDLSPADSAADHWNRHRNVFPPELVPYKNMIWLETINEVDKGRAEWMGEFAYNTAQLVMAEGFRWAAFSWSSGEPEPDQWQGPKMLQFLQLAGNNPDQVAIALHEYNYDAENMESTYPWLIGRFTQLYQICDNRGIPRPTVVITEFGWGSAGPPDVSQPMNVDIPWSSALYANYPQVQGAGIWYLGGGVNDVAQKLIAPLADYAVNHFFEIPK